MSFVFYVRRTNELKRTVFADPKAAGRRSAELRGLVGNSRWGRSMLQKQFHHPGAPKKPHLCEYCGEEIHAKTDSHAQLIKERLAYYEKRRPQPVVE